MNLVGEPVLATEVVEFNGFATYNIEADNLAV